MSHSPHKPDGKQSALLSELKKRKTQQLQQAIEEKRRTQTTGPAAPQIEPTDPRRTTQVALVVPPTAAPPTVTASPPAQRLSRSRRVALLVVCAGLLVVAICAGTVLLATNSAGVSTPALATLPTVTAREVVNYLKTAGVPITAARELAVVPEVWAAHQEFEVEIRRGNDKGLFIVLSYAVPQQKISDMFRVNTHQKFKAWQVMTVANVILLVAPETSEPLRTELASHLTQYLEAPYRSFWPTATPTSAPTTQK